ncbi:MAG: ATP-binding protein [Desulfopila sp.]|jgi:signal transduction histidine kinase|nr:ATP-binding protein [Desulfopila sp.]
MAERNALIERGMLILSQLKPAFLRHHSDSGGSDGQILNFRRIWELAILLTSIVTLVPLILITSVDYQYTKRSIESENSLRTLRVASNIRHSISFFFHERLAALSFIVRDSSYEELADPEKLEQILLNLRQSFSGFADLGLINQSGLQVSYVGPYNLLGKNYDGQPWFEEVQEKGFHISDVFLGFRDAPHLVIAVKRQLADGQFYVLRTAFDTERFNGLIANFDLSGRGEAFVINQKGIIQSPSRRNAKLFEKVEFAVPPHSERTEVMDVMINDESFLVCSAYIPDTPYILIVLKEKEELIKVWKGTRLRLIGFLVVSIVVILLVILGVSTYMVNNMYTLDQRRLAALHKVEYSNKLASIGRLAAGIAHEINNPLAIINEKAGLIKDLFTYTKTYQNDEKIIAPLTSIISSVERCGKITRRLLGFARHIDDSVIDTVDVVAVIEEVLSFLKKEAEYRSIAIKVEIADQIPPLQCDRGKLQQIFLNIVNNAFAAMDVGGKLDIKVSYDSQERILVKVRDNGYGISQEDIGKIFEPFFSTKKGSGGTGLGLSVTYGLVQEIGGKIGVESVVGEGTTFTVALPLTASTADRE